MRGGTLHGAKVPCSGAGHATRAVVTVGTGDGVRLAIVDPRRAEVTPMRGMLHGMRAAVNGRAAFDGVALDADAFRRLAGRLPQGAPTSPAARGAPWR